MNISKKEINTIIREFKILARGHKIKVPMPVIKLSPINISINWESDSHCETSYWDGMRLDRKHEAVIRQTIEDQISKHRNKYNIRIKKFLNKVEKLEKKYSLPHDQLWEDYLWPLAL